MTQDEVLSRLAAIVIRRKKVAVQAAAIEAEERDLIAEAWRAGIGPGQIATTADRSDAHVRKLRPTDVPPARTGGGAAKPRRKVTRAAKPKQ